MGIVILAATIFVAWAALSALCWALEGVGLLLSAIFDR